MKFLPLVWRNLMRRKVRTTFTLLSIFVAFLLYAFLMTIRTAFSMGVEVAGVDRLMMMHKVSLIQLLPISYMRDIQSTQQQNAASLGSLRESTAAQNAELKAQNTELKAQNVELKRISRQLNALGVQVDALHGSFATLTTSSIPPSTNSRSSRHARASSPTSA